jgi:phage host-nuclease inhibitor protein Gam
MSAQPVTKDDLDHAIEQSESRLRGEIERTESRLVQRIAEASEHTARVTNEYTDHAIDRSESRLMQRIAEASEHTARVMMDRMDRVAGELATRIDELATHVGEMATRIDELPERMGKELARHIRASDERNLDAIRTIDDQYRGLPGEVVALQRRVDAHVEDDSRHVGGQAGGGVKETER